MAELLLLLLLLLQLLDFESLSKICRTWHQNWIPRNLDNYNS